MATKVEKLNSGNYRVRTSYVDETGKQRFKSFTAETPKEAKFLASQFEVERKHQSKPENVSLREAIERFISNRENILSPSTIVGYQQLQKNAYGSIIDMRLGYINKEEIQKVINDYAKDHSPKSVRNALGLLSSVLKEFYPAINVNGVKLPQAKKNEIDIPTTEEVGLILEAAKNGPIYLPILFGAYLGLRKSEIFALTWDDIDLDNSTVSINKATVRNRDGMYVIKPTKTTNSTRTLTIPSLIKEELVARRQEDKALFDVPLETFDNRYKLMIKRIGLKCNFHALRHYNASIMLQLNVPIKYAMERMGHATDNMLKNVYQHTFKTEQDLIAERLDEFFSGKNKKG